MTSSREKPGKFGPCDLRTQHTSHYNSIHTSPHTHPRLDVIPYIHPILVLTTMLFILKDTAFW
jgi:hypothetical protein